MTCWQCHGAGTMGLMHQNPCSVCRGGATAVVTASKHTPGPWRVDAAESTQSSVRFKSVHRAGNVHAEICRVYGGMRGQDMAQDALLIAAAPDLLAALKQALQLLKNSRAGKNPDVMQATGVLYDAIAKAEGRPTP